MVLTPEDGTYTTHGMTFRLFIPVTRGQVPLLSFAYQRLRAAEALATAATSGY